MREQGTATRRRYRHRKTRVLAAVAAAAAAGVTTTLLTGSASHPPSPLATLTGALAETSHESYSFTLGSTTKFEGKEVNADVVSGAFDPQHQRGTELLAAYVTQNSGRSPRAQIRFTGKYVYTSVSPGSGLETLSKPWDKSPLPASGADVLSVDDLYGFVTDWPVSPDELLGVLQRSAPTVRDSGPASGPGWTGTRYTFTARLSAQSSLSGIEYIDTQGRVRRLVTTTTRKWVTTSRDLTFGDFGAPVPVTAPPASQVQYTSMPYWGFYFLTGLRA